MKAADLVAAVQKAVGSPYWYGCYGQVSTLALLDYKSKQYPAMYTADRIATCKTQLGRRVWDCVGLIKGNVWDADFGGKYQSASDKSANGMYALCTQQGDIASIPEIPGLVVWKDGHIGVYVGGGVVVEARGFASGVVRTMLKDRPWTNWGKCHLIDYSVPVPTDWEKRALAAEATVTQLTNDLHAQAALCSAQADSLRKAQADLAEADQKLAGLKGAARILAAFADEA